MKTYQTLVKNCPQYRDYIEHEFVRGLGDGTLAESAFRFYLQQDFLFLVHFTRAWGLAVYKSDNLADMRAAQAGVNAMLDTEIGLHIDYCAQWGISEEELYQLAEHPSMVAYTRYVLDSGLKGTLAEMHVALVPCIIGYADVARWLGEQSWLKRDGNPYLPWIEMYQSDAFQQAAANEGAYLDRLCANISPADMPRLQRIFNTATDMEIAFWQMGLDNA